MDTKTAWTLSVWLTYLTPLFIGGVVGSAVFWLVRRWMVWLRGSDWLRAVSGSISAVLSGITGFMAARFLLGWLNSLPRDTSDTGTAFGLLSMFMTMLAGSIGVGAAVGTGLWQSTSLQGDEPTDGR